MHPLTAKITCNGQIEWGLGGSGEAACHAFYLLFFCVSAVADFLLTQFLTVCVPPWSEQRGTIQMGIK